MYASVRFRDDDAREVVSVEEIKHFNPKDTSDFDCKKWYKVHWEDDQQNGFFSAQILRLFETREAASQLPTKRVPLPPRPSDTEDDESGASESSGDSLKQVFRKAADRCSKSKSVAAFRGDHLKSLFEKKGGPSSNELLQLRNENRRLKGDNEKLQYENKQLHTRIEMLEKALCSAVFDTESRLQASKSSGFSAAEAAQKNNDVAAAASYPQQVLNAASGTPSPLDSPPDWTEPQKPLHTTTTISVVGDKVCLTGPSVHRSRMLAL